MFDDIVKINNLYIFFIIYQILNLSGEILETVGQIGVEIHSATYTYAGPEQPKRQRYVFGELLKSFYDLHKKLGFRLVSYNPNGCFHTSNDDPYFINYSYFDLLFYKVK